MKLSRASYDWAIKHLMRDHDTDLFPLPIEIDALEAQWSFLAPEFEKLDVSSYAWRGGRRFVVPKGALAFRLATQLDPVDSIVMSALLYEYGPKLERSRSDAAKERVFSYRFAPDDLGRMYSYGDSWYDFWRASKEKAKRGGGGFVLVADISDFYNQIYHHVLERQFSEAALPAPVVKAFKRYLQTPTDKVSRGVPVGPHSSHILAECALDALDRSLLSHGIDHCRYVDDIHIFAGSRVDAVGALYTLTQILDSQQRLVLQNTKTRMLPMSEFELLSETMLLDNPINEREREILELIAREAGGDPYAEVSLAQLESSDLEVLDDDTLTELIQLYLAQSPVDYQRLAWLIRRLTQVGAPGAIRVLVESITVLSPILGPVARYIMAAAPNYEGALEELGASLIEALEFPIIDRSPYLQMVLGDVVARIPGLNHVDALTARYLKADQAVRRSILLAAGSGHRGDWLRDRKPEFRTMDPWSRRAFIKAAKALPGDEPKFWLDSVRDNLRPLERAVAKHYFPDFKSGEIKIGLE